MSEVKVSIVNPLEQETRLKLDSKGAGEFVPEHAGMHEIVLTVDDIRYCKQRKELHIIGT